MMDRHPILAKEGWPFIGLSLIIALAGTFFAVPFWLDLLLWAIFVFVVQFFRDPHRVAVGKDSDVLSPADGRVIVVETTKNPYLNGVDAIRISVFMNVFNVHSNRSPCHGEVIDCQYHAGSFLNAALDKASEQNERNALSMKTRYGDITFVQIAGLVARRILCYAKPGQTLSRGERYGFIRFGSRVDVYLPTTAQIRVVIGDRVEAATSVLASFPG